MNFYLKKYFCDKNKNLVKLTKNRNYPTNKSLYLQDQNKRITDLQDINLNLLDLPNLRNFEEIGLFDQSFYSFMYKNSLSYQNKVVSKKNILQA
jgi:hypothetical protein